MRASHSHHGETTTLGDISLLDRSMYYWTPAIQTPIEQHIDFDGTQPPILSPPKASHVIILLLFYLHTLNTQY